VRANSTVGIVELMSPGDGGRVSFKPADASVMAATATIFEGGGHRSLSTDFGITWENVTLGLDSETTAVLQIDPTPGLAHPLVFTHSQPSAAASNRIFYKPLDLTTPWQEASGSAISGAISQLDHTTEPTLHELLVTVEGSRKLYVYSDVRVHLGNLDLFDHTPPLPALSNGVRDAHGNADKSDLQPQTLYYTTAGSRPSRAFRSGDGGQTWTDLTGDLPTGNTGPDFNKLIGNPHNRQQFLLATSRGIYRTDNSGLHWYLYAEGLRLGEDVQDVVINTRGLTHPTLYIGTKGRGFWWRSLE